MERGFRSSADHPRVRSLIHFIDNTRMTPTTASIMMVVLTIATTTTGGQFSQKAATAAGIFDGTAPQNPMTREQAAATYRRMGLLDKKGE